MYKSAFAFLFVLLLSMMPVGTLDAATVRIEESHPSIVRSAEWFAVSDSSVSGGRVGVTKRIGAWATIYFTGTGIKWIGYNCSCAQGMARVWVDGKLVNVSVQTWKGTGTTPQVEMYSVSGLAPGKHSFTVQASGFMGNAYGDYLVVDAFDIENGDVRMPDAQEPAAMQDDWPPVARLTSPLYPDNIVTGMVTLTAEASDTLTAVTRVRFFAGDTLIGEDTTAPYAITRDTSAIPGGSSYLIRVLAFDAAGNSGSSPYSEVTVRHGDQTRPVVTLTSPAVGSTVSGTIELAGAASDESGIANVQFLVEYHAYSVETINDSTAPYTATLDTTGLHDGNHIVQVTAQDGARNDGRSGWTMFKVDNSVTASMTRIDNSNPGIVYTGSWGGTNVIDPAAYEPRWHWATVAATGSAGSTASYTFEGTGIRWLAGRCWECGVADVSLDGGPAQRIDLHGSDFSVRDPSRAVYSSSVLPYGTHTLKITVLPAQIDGRSQIYGSLVTLDALEVLK
ncbi:MAG: Ig-like domain-containing protein [Pseudomonadota bacterium]